MTHHIALQFHVNVSVERDNGLDLRAL